MKTTSLRLARIIVALGAVLGLSACSAIKLGYNNFPEVAYWWMDGYIDFDDEQAPRARAELARLHGWHRQQELPRYIEILGRMERIVPGAVAPQQACSLVAEVRGRLKLVADQAEPAVAALAASLTPDQLRHLERKHHSNNDKFRKDWIHAPLPQQKDKRHEQALDRLESIYGRLDAAQRQVLQRSIEQSTFDPQRVLAERLRRQQDLLQTLRRLMEPGLAPAAARELVRGYVERVQRSPDARYRAWQDDLQQENCRTFAAVHESTTAAQREQAVRRLRAYQRDLRELAEQQP
ncbi:MAG: hypothetical protein JWP65_3790 [Ramlibacter sp.]|jgi:hypothetical protein|uniref:DUF6279 family lipoprotein n=1 Tax=Ramlibacter sp. TaxID=1917967 RepID=UPI002606428F|nr:DUF6279 family lipoprotein [Ramlibacter sp.]MDB5753369.1 hypothetical protein [Ramlibacter sp.]